MEFQNPKMIFTLLSVLIPILIHFFIRAKIKSLPFPAIFFLKETIKKKSSQIRFSQFLLLFVRILMVSFLSLAVMQPFINTRSFLASFFPSSADYVLIVDSSLSMRLSHGGLKTFDIMKNFSLEFLDRLSSSDHVSVMTTDSLSRLISKPYSFPTEKYIREVESGLQCGYGRCDLLSVYKRAENLLLKTPSSEKGIVIFSDFQRSGSLEFKNYIQNKKTPFPTLLMLPGEEQTTPLNNLFVENMELPLVSYLQEAEVPVSIKISSSGQGFTKGILSVNVNSSPAGDLNLNIGEGASQDLVITTTRDISSDKIVQTQISGDSFTEDNNFYGIFRGPPVINILILENTNNKTPFYFRNALDPYLGTGVTGKTPFVIETAARLSNAKDLNRYNLILCSDPADLLQEEIAALKKYAFDGGSLIICFGNLYSAEKYNEILFSEEAAGGLVPGKLSHIKELQNNEASLLPTDEGLETFKLISDNSFWKYAKCKKIAEIEKGSLDPLCQMLLKTGSNDPFLLLKKTGTGEICWFMTCLSPEATSIVTEPVFLPLVHKMADLLSRQNRIRLFNIVDDRLYPQAVTKNTFCFSPSGEKIKFEPDENGNNYIAASLPGIYRVFEDKTEIKQFAVNTPNDESKLDFIRKAQWQEQAPPSLYTASNLDQITRFLNDRKSRIAVWRILLWTVLLLLLLEIFISSRLRP